MVSTPILLASSELGPLAVADEVVGGAVSLASNEGSVKSWSSRSEVARDMRWTMARRIMLGSCPLTFFSLLLITLLLMTLLIIMPPIITLLIIVLLRGAEAAIQCIG